MEQPITGYLRIGKRVCELADISSTRGTSLEDPEVINYTNNYVRRLLAEAVYVYAKLYNPGGSVILTSTGLIDADRTYEYTSMIGNPFHLDLIELMEKMGCLSKKEQEALWAWAEGLTPAQAAQYLHSRGSVTIKADALRKRRERGIHTLTESFNEEEKVTGENGQDSPVSSGTGRPEAEDGAPENGRRVKERRDIDGKT
jgi:hypothetical protein